MVLSGTFCLGARSGRWASYSICELKPPRQRDVEKAYPGEKTKVPEGKPLSIRLLGPPEATLRGRGLRFGTKKALALLCYLAAEGKKYPRGELAGLLWPRSDQRRARTDLRSTLSRLRRACGEGNGSSEGGSLF